MMESTQYVSVFYKINTNESNQGGILKLKSIPRLGDVVFVDKIIYYVELVRICSYDEEEDAIIVLSDCSPEEILLDKFSELLNNNLSVFEDLSVNLRKLDQIEDLLRS